LNELQQNTDDHRKAVAEVFHAMGRSMFMYQRIEQSLKLLLPYIVKDGEKIPENPYRDMKELLASKNTMGPLFERLKKSIEAPDSESVNAYLERVVANRNELIHSFSKLSFGSLATIEICEEALAYIKGKHLYAVPLHQIIDQFLQVFVKSLEDEEFIDLKDVE